MTKKQKTKARLMFKKSLTAGFVDAKKVMIVLKEATSQKPTHIISILKLTGD